MRMYRGDLKPDLTIDLFDGTTPKDITTATSVKVIGTLNGQALFNRAATTFGVGGTNRVVMQWQAADTITAGTIVVEVEVTWPGAKPQTFRPTDVVDLAPDLG